jgi:uncharacterized protein (DUF1330 family)
MDLHNAMLPGPEQIAWLRGSGDPSPVVMVNLLKFRPRAIYADGRETGFTGLDAFMHYSELMKPIVESFGGRFLVSALLDRLVIGEGEMAWDRIALVEYPSRAVFFEVLGSPRVQEAAVHRRAGLEGQLLIASTLQADHR